MGNPDRIMDGLVEGIPELLPGKVNVRIENIANNGKVLEFKLVFDLSES